MTRGRTTGPRVPVRLATGPHVTAAQPAVPPTLVHIGSDRMLASAREVDIAQIAPDPDQPRRAMDGERLAELAESIAQHGLLQPLVVRQEGLDTDGNMRYVVIAGGRRHAAIRHLLARVDDETMRQRVSRVPVIVSDSVAAERRVLQLIENLQREDLNPVEEARALKEILRIEGLTTTGLAARVHRSQGYIDERLRLLRHEEVEAAVESGLLTKSAGAAIASLAEPGERQAWLARAHAGAVIRPRDIYASKTGRRADTHLPNFGNRCDDIGANAPSDERSAASANVIMAGDGGSRSHGAAHAKAEIPPVTQTQTADDALVSDVRAMSDRLMTAIPPTVPAHRRQIAAELAELRVAIDTMLARLST